MKPYYETPLGKLYHGDCLEIMPGLDTVDLVLTDPPYGVTQNKWDTVIPFKDMWSALDLITNDKTAIVMTATNPFAADLICSNSKMFRYDMVWRKVGKATGFLNANRMPLRNHELILVFYKILPKYNPQKTKGNPNNPKFAKGSHSRGRKMTNNNYGMFNQDHQSEPTTDKFPLSVQDFPAVHPPVHPTEKPIKLFEWLIKTYTDKNEIVLDFCIGSGTTAIACERLKRKWIGIEIEEKYCEIAAKRIEQERKQLKLF